MAVLQPKFLTYYCNYRLRKYLQRKKGFNDDEIEYPFEFEREVIQKSTNKKERTKFIDIGVNSYEPESDSNLIYCETNPSELLHCIEAKRLPTDKVGKKREKEYAIGKKGGGIQRFKDNKHGKDSKGNLLKRNGMVGYVQENDFNHWHTQINQWIIDEPTWSNTEMLQKVDFGTIAKLESTHERISKDNLKLTHFWINLC